MIVRLALSVMITIAFADLAVAQPAQKPSSGIGYPSVAAALEAVKAKPSVRVSVQDGWTVIAEQGGLVLWTFTPLGHPAHPTVARREAKQHTNGAWYVDQRVLCQAAKAACDKINAEFVELNSKMRRALERDRPRPDRLPPASAN